MIKDILTNKKKLTFAIVALILAVAIIATVTVIVIKNNSNSSKKTDGTSNVITKTTADSLKTQAIEANKNNDKAKAKTLFQEARDQYKELNDVNNVVDTEAQLYLLEHP